MQRTNDWVAAGEAVGVTNEELAARTLEGRDAFIAAAEQMGLTAEDAAALADQMNLIPLYIPTTFTTPGLSTAISQVKQLNDAIRKIPGSTRYTVAGYNTTGGSTFADGGPVRGPGTGTSDSINARLSNGEHVVTAREVAGAGGNGAVMAQRAQWAKGYAEGGPVLMGPPRIGSRAGSGDGFTRLHPSDLAELKNAMSVTVAVSDEAIARASEHGGQLTTALGG